MPIELAGIRLERIHRITTLEQADFVSHRIPGLEGNVVQNMGRDSVRLQVEGIFYGSAAREEMESLREAYKSKGPVDFLADIVGGAYFAQVLLERFEVYQSSEEPDQFSYVLTIAEYVAPPAPEGLPDLFDVDAAIAGEAGTFMADSLGAVSVLQHPSSLAETLAIQPNVLEYLSTDELGSVIAKNAARLSDGDFSNMLTSLAGTLVAQPNVLERIGMDELGSAIAKKASGLSGADFSNMLKAIGGIKPETAMEFIQAVRDAGSLGDFLSKYAEEGLDLLEDLTGLDMSVATTLVKAFAEGTTFLKSLKAVSDRAGALVDDLKNFDPLADLGPVLKRMDMR